MESTEPRIRRLRDSETTIYEYFSMTYVKTDETSTLWDFKCSNCGGRSEGTLFRGLITCIHCILRAYQLAHGMTETLLERSDRLDKLEKDLAARTIQRAAHNWLWKPPHGINIRLGFKECEKVVSDAT